MAERSTTEQRRPVRCAIYTRKSTEEGLEQEFNSLDAQFEACAAYIASQRHEAWTQVRDRYDDGGFTGGNLDRPALQRLLTDVVFAEHLGFLIDHAQAADDVADGDRHGVRPGCGCGSSVKTPRLGLREPPPR